ncbi:hypothetical protein FJT64_017405 [Amphibalanus amphitrite]|uniref:DUF4789 domain-containing protein n=1 Tax=Amphibalanus amphitrite TaxID=1232801 RepID=A0A6A4X722_AMPAM|nr:hypothetical protein FJT64_017405 [Amphibalanus amphitrite]
MHSRASSYTAQPPSPALAPAMSPDRQTGPAARLRLPSGVRAVIWSVTHSEGRASQRGKRWNLSEAGSVIAPPWVDAALNPCSSESWQLVRWPADGQCYPIFQQGPCPASQELVWDSDAGRAACRCPDGYLLHGPTQRCYRRHTRGPCPLRHSLQVDAASGEARCRRHGKCPPGELFWPSDGQCYRYLSRGPCGKGELLTVSQATLEPQCGCSRRLMARSYWPHTDSCYQQYTRGPCPRGLVFAFNATRRRTECHCHAGLTRNFDPSSGQCFTLGERGPCPVGNEFVFNNVTARPECRCPDDSLVLADSGACYRAFSQGPCGDGRFVAPRPEAPHQGVCVRNPCRPGELYFPSDKFCHRIGGRGPCPLGQLVHYEQFRGISYRGACGCAEHFEQNYWPEDGQCYELQTRGPCPPNFTFRFDADRRRTECVCDPELGRLLEVNSGRCEQVVSAVPPPCPVGHADTRGCQCPPGLQADPRTGQCVPPLERGSLRSRRRLTRSRDHTAATDTAEGDSHVTGTKVISPR